VLWSPMDHLQARYPRYALGWAFQRVQRHWRFSDARLAQFLEVPLEQLPSIAACAVPPLTSVGFDGRIRDIAIHFRLAPRRLAFVCRAAMLDSPRLREQ
ncbi:MAG TPA: hypothetical protein VGW38_17890, partial [Chloroflexota bacterium]|nr:hypothetical protein [Chloroflexota bacterium]